MKTSNYIKPSKSQKVDDGKVDDGKVSDEILRTMMLATRALDGHGLSDEELEILCDAMLSLEILPGQTRV